MLVTSVIRSLLLDISLAFGLESQCPTISPKDMLEVTSQIVGTTIRL